MVGFPQTQTGREPATSTPKKGLLQRLFSQATGNPQECPTSPQPSSWMAGRQSCVRMRGGIFSVKVSGGSGLCPFPPVPYLWLGSWPSFSLPEVSSVGFLWAGLAAQPSGSHRQAAPSMAEARYGAKEVWQPAPYPSSPCRAPTWHLQAASLGCLVSSCPASTSPRIEGPGRAWGPPGPLTSLLLAAALHWCPHVSGLWDVALGLVGIPSWSTALVTPVANCARSRLSPPCLPCPAGLLWKLQRQ